jgi:hypothetical protein
MAEALLRASRLARRMFSGRRTSPLPAISAKLHDTWTGFPPRLLNPRVWPPITRDSS